MEKPRTTCFNDTQLKEEYECNYRDVPESIHDHLESSDVVALVLPIITELEFRVNINL